MKSPGRILSLSFLVGIVLLMSCGSKGKRTSEEHDIPNGAKYKETVYATEYSKGDTINSMISIVFYDSVWNQINGEFGISTADSAERIAVMHVDSLQTINAVLVGADTLYYLIEVRDFDNNSMISLQIKEGDTMVNQKFVYDSLGRNIEVYNMIDGKYSLWSKTNYDSNGDIAAQTTYDEYSGEVILIDKYEVDSLNRKLWLRAMGNNSFQLMSRSTKIDSASSKIENFYDQEGFVYGIKIMTVKGGHDIIQTNASGKTTKWETYDKSGRLTSSIYHVYEKL